MTTIKPRRKTVCVRGFDVDLYAVVKARAKAEGVLVRDWLERALIHELARARKQELRMEAELSDSSS